MSKFKVGDLVKFDPDENWNKDNYGTVCREGCRFNKAYEIKNIVKDAYGHYVITILSLWGHTRWMEDRFMFAIPKLDFDNFNAKSWNAYAKRHLLT